MDTIASLIIGIIGLIISWGILYLIVDATAALFEPPAGSQ
jgi:hypothetical protein